MSARTSERPDEEIEEFNNDISQVMKGQKTNYFILLLNYNTNVERGVEGRHNLMSEDIEQKTGIEM